MTAALFAALIGGARAQDRAPAEPNAPLPRAVGRIPDAERAQRLARHRDSLVLTLDDLQKKRAASQNPTIPIRDLTNGALLTLVLGRDPKDAEALLRHALSAQVMDPAAPNYGDVPWQVGPNDVQDRNAIEFAMQPIGPLLKLYGDRLSPEMREALVKKHVPAALAALRRHEVKVTYTNIFVMKAVNLILLGEAIGDKTAADEGYALFDQWREWTRKNGVREFVSTTYYGVTLNSLGLGLRLAERPEAKPKFRAALDYLWSDICANYFAGRSSTTGPRSRDYDFLRGSGGLHLYLFVEGLRDYHNLGKPDLEKVYLLLNQAPDGYRPPESVLALAALPERVVEQRWDAGEFQDRYHYLALDFTIGTASGNYGPQDRPFSIDIASPKDLPIVSIFPDILDNPYGRVKIKGRDGHSKPVHQPLNPVFVQEKGAVLALVDVDGRRVENAATFATNVVLPSNAEKLVVGGEPVDLSKPREVPVPLNAVIGVKEGKTGIAIRVFALDGAGGQKPALVLKSEEDGLRYRAARLALYHYRGTEPTTLTDRRVRVGLLFLAAPCASDADFAALLRRAQEAKIEQTGDAATQWTVAAQAAPDVLLEAGYNIRERKILYRRVNKKPFGATATLTVNGGEDLAAILTSGGAQAAR